jgi:hypothetical protein
MGSLAEGAVAGFSTTTPNWAKAVGVSSSMGIRIDGAGIDVGIFATWQKRCVLSGQLIDGDGEVELEL